jgi:hypothetical protein
MTAESKNLRTERCLEPLETAQFLNGVITACWNHFLTDYLASLGDVACCGAFMSIFRFLCCGALACS